MNTPEAHTPDVSHDLHQTPTPAVEVDETYIDSPSSQVITNILILAIAARPQHTQQTLIRRQDEHLINGKPLQQQAIEILRDATQAGLYRMRGEHVIQSVDHSIYDQLFDRFPEKDHVAVMERLAEYTWHKSYLLSHPDTYELQVEERQRFKETEECIAKLGFKVFRDMFLGYATTDEPPEKYQDLLERTIDPEVLLAFLDENYISLHRQFIPLHIDKAKQGREYDFYDWMLAQARHIRGRHIGRRALTAAAK